MEIHDTRLRAYRQAIILLRLGKLLQARVDITQCGRKTGQIRLDPVDAF